MNQAIHPSQIEEELERIWDSLEGTSKMRACLFNLIFYTRKNKRKAYLDEVAKKVVEKFPSRVIFITMDEEAHDLSASVSIMTAEEGECSIVCDLINIDSSGRDAIKVPFLVLPHLLPDLPIYLVYADDPAHDDPVSQKLERFATRTIFDSETTESIPAFATSILEHKTRAKCDIADLNWARIESWRELLTSTFKTSDKLAILRNASTIHIHFNAVESDSICHTKVQAIYLQGWLSTRLGWKLQKATKEDFVYENGDNPLTVHLHPELISNLPAGRIVSITIETSGEETYAFRRNADRPHHVSVELSTPNICSIPTHVIFDRDESGASLVKEICHKGTSKHYLQLLDFLQTLDPKAVCH